MRGWFGKPARSALVVSVFVLLVSPAVDPVGVGAMGIQARQYLTTASVTATGFYNNQIAGQFSEPVTLLLMGAAFLVLARRVRKSGSPTI
jgi:hypothetical protein